MSLGISDTNFKAEMDFTYYYKIYSTKQQNI